MRPASKVCRHKPSVVMGLRVFHKINTGIAQLRDDPDEQSFLHDGHSSRIGSADM